MWKGRSKQGAEGGARKAAVGVWSGRESTLEETEQEGSGSPEGENQTHLSTPPRREQRSALRMEGSMS